MINKLHRDCEEDRWYDYQLVIRRLPFVVKQQPVAKGGGGVSEKKKGFIFAQNVLFLGVGVYF